MGRWGDTPDCSDDCLDFFASVLQRHFLVFETDKYNSVEDVPEEECDPGLDIRLNMRIGRLPKLQPNEMAGLYASCCYYLQNGTPEKFILGSIIMIAKIMDGCEIGVFAGDKFPEKIPEGLSEDLIKLGKNLSDQLGYKEISEYFSQEN